MQACLHAVLYDPDMRGSCYSSMHVARIRAAYLQIMQLHMHACRLSGIEPWELYRVNNSCCQGMPLGVPEKDAASNPVGQSLLTA